MISCEYCGSNITSSPVLRHSTTVKLDGKPAPPEQQMWTTQITCFMCERTTIVAVFNGDSPIVEMYDDYMKSIRR